MPHVNHFLAANGTTALRVDVAKRRLYHLPDDLETVFSCLLQNGGEPVECKALAHNFYQKYPYDGLLISKAFIDATESGIFNLNRKSLRQAFKDGRLSPEAVQAYKRFKKQKTIHNILLARPEVPIMGDCGAFSFVTSKVPPFDTEEILDYYTQYGFDQGVSVDHIIFGDMEDKKFRYELTISNAQDFIKEHRKRGLPWTPIGSLQGWNVSSYSKAAGLYAKMGYKYLALGGIIKSSTEYILRLLQGIRDELVRVGCPDVVIHLFGVTRFMSIPDFGALGAKSFDSTSLFQQSYRGDNGFLLQDGWHPTVTLPVMGTTIKNRTAEEDEPFDVKAYKKQSTKLLKRILLFIKSGKKRPPKKLVSDIVNFNILTYPSLERKSAELHRSVETALTERLWKKCGCRLCKMLGVRIMLTYTGQFYFARGLHNLFVFQTQIYPKIEAGVDFPFFRRPDKVIYMKPVFDLPIEERETESS